MSIDDLIIAAYATTVLLLGITISVVATTQI